MSHDAVSAKRRALGTKFYGNAGSPGFCELSIRFADESIENVAVSILF